MDKIDLLKVNEMTERAIKTSETALRLASDAETAEETNEYIRVAMEAQELAIWLVAYQGTNYIQAS